MHNYDIKQPVVCCIMRGQDSTLTGLLPLESFGSLIRILNLLISTDSSSVVSYPEQVGRYPLSGMCFLIGRIIPWTNAMGSDSGISLPRVYKCSNKFFVHESQDDSN